MNRLPYLKPIQSFKTPATEGPMKSPNEKEADQKPDMRP